MPKPAALPPCTNCHHDGGQIVALEAFPSSHHAAEVPGFQIVCSCCDCRTPPATTRATVRRNWAAGRVITPFESAQHAKLADDIEAEIAEEARQRAEARLIALYRGEKPTPA